MGTKYWWSAEPSDRQQGAVARTSPKPYSSYGSSQQAPSTPSLHLLAHSPLVDSPLLLDNCPTLLSLLQNPSVTQIFYKMFPLPIHPLVYGCSSITFRLPSHSKPVSPSVHYYVIYLPLSNSFHMLLNQTLKSLT
ncbi:hypothetical protein CRENBAI_011395 [Crenichthys baileyi]|uniref:Uncharacterized protein n=1 Tax=Crenichthys baileyi TaxID=28760 RepID=A0AAV9SL38_9TELE